MYLVALTGCKATLKGVFNLGIYSNVVFFSVYWQNLVESGLIGDSYTKP